MITPTMIQRITQRERYLSKNGSFISAYQDVSKPTTIFQNIGVQESLLSKVHQTLEDMKKDFDPFSLGEKI